jgi:hypothetical protein
VTFEETGITNLGPVPEGMTFLEAARAVADQRKYAINPEKDSRRLTICETMRELHRRADALPEPHRSDIQTLAGAGFDFGKRMNQRMIDLKAML